MTPPLIGVFAVVQIAYLLSLCVTGWLYTRPVDLVEPTTEAPGDDAPEIIVLYPVLDELEATMRTSMLGFARAQYPEARRRVVAIPNADDVATIEALRRIALEHPFLEILPVPPTRDPTWAPVWTAWDGNTHAYWWHVGKRSRVRDLPPKKTRQLIYAFYAMAARRPDALLSYVDADSVVPADFFQTAAVGIRDYDVLQNTNVTGNALASWSTTMFAMDHLLWDGSLYQHMSARGRHPFYVLGKGLFFKVSDLLELGGFNPWLTIEDPEVGMRLWTHGRRLGIIRSPLIEEVPNGFRAGITQRKRWIAGFFQTLGAPLTLMGMTLGQRVRARLNLVPCGSLVLNPVGLAIGVWALVEAFTSRRSIFPPWLEAVCGVTIALSVMVIAVGQRAAMRQTRSIFPTRRERVRYMLRVNPAFVLVYWVWWAIPLVVGFWMYLTDGGLRWERTPKNDANHDLVRSQADLTQEQAEQEQAEQEQAEREQAESEEPVGAGPPDVVAAVAVAAPEGRSVFQVRTTSGQTVIHGADPSPIEFPTFGGAAAHDRDPVAVEGHVAGELAVHVERTAADSQLQRRPAFRPPVVPGALEPFASPRPVSDLRHDVSFAAERRASSRRHVKAVIGTLTRILNGVNQPLGGVSRPAKIAHQDAVG